ncbi:MAG: hypothetical protein AB1428_02950 [Bacteroidota bacterium]
MESILGPGNGMFEYLLVLIVYAALFILMRYAHPAVELNFRVSFWVLYFGWGIGVFIGNYLFSLLGIMSFLPWLNNAFHTLVWIGLCLGFLYAGCRRNPMWEQFLLFFTFSFIVKWAERTILGTWEMDHFLMIPGNIAYILGWSLIDGVYPMISQAGLRLAGRYFEGVVS